MLEHVYLKNFKSFSEIEVNFSALTLLSGLNGSGKSSVLQALGILRQSFDANFLAVGDIILNGDLVEIGTGKDLLYQHFDVAELVVEIGLRKFEPDKQLRWRAAVSPTADVLSCTNFAGERISEASSLFGKGFQFLRADRITPAVTYPRSQHAVRQKRFLGARGEFTAHFMLEFGTEIETPKLLVSPQDESATTLSAQVNAWMQHFSPGVRVEAVKVPMTDFVRLVFSYRGEGTGYGESFRPTNVGFGLTHALPIITACLAAEPGTLLVIENPEAQLHPRGQAAIGRLLALTAACGVQVVVETHSDHVLNGIRLAVKQRHLPADDVSLHFFSRKPGASSDFETPVVSQDGRLSYWPTGFFDQWEQSLDQLLD